MGAITDLLGSERGLFAILLIIGATVLTAMGKMTVDSWQSFAQIIFGTYVAGKTASSVTGLLTARRAGACIASTLVAAAPSIPPATPAAA